MRNNKLVLGLLTAALALGGLTGCSNGDKEKNSNTAVTVTDAPENTADTTTAATPSKSAETENTDDTKSEGFVLTYPEHMQELGFKEPVELEEVPETIVTLSTYPVLTLFAMDVKLAAVPSTKVIEYPEDYDGVILPGVMSGTFDIEQVVAMQPDLVIMPSSSKEQYGATLEGLDIPVYYVAMTSASTDVYNLIKEQTQAFVDAFSTDAESKTKGEAVMAKFDTLNEKLEEVKKLTEGKTVMSITVSGESSIYINSATSTLGCMLDMCGLENVFQPGENAGVGHSMNEMDMETSIGYDPDIMVVCGSSTLEDNKALMDSIYELNKDYWDMIDAYKEGRVIYLPSSYVSTAGINIISNIEDLIVLIENLCK